MGRCHVQRFIFICVIDTCKEMILGADGGSLVKAKCTVSTALYLSTKSTPEM